ncbi:hypothetical protein Pcinc_030421 [Petrolisthes cinctipes]|uniref:Uncharacterized protein n=1 Tax=Petrolisthes cinctipes TaxID=88211 RepID=A0AAE1K498_PETCI|nr:hypothetical protein Pcinc_030421 [Petrolisthes cinctipes]
MKIIGVSGGVGVSADQNEEDEEEEEEEEGQHSAPSALLASLRGEGQDKGRRGEPDTRIKSKIIFSPPVPSTTTTPPCSQPRPKRPTTLDIRGGVMTKAALWDNAELLEDLLNGDQLSHLDCRDAWGRTPLHAAATTEASRCLRILLQAGADVNLASGPRAEGRTCLHIASEHGAVENIRLLLDHGADLLAKDANGLTALDLAEQGDHANCMTILKNAAGTVGYHHSTYFYL